MFGKLRARMAAMTTISSLLGDAEVIAQERGLKHPSAEHLVLAALDLTDGTGQRAMQRLGSSKENLTAALQVQEAEDLERIGVQPPQDAIEAALPTVGDPSGIYRSEPSAQQLFQRAGQDARRNGGALLGAHVLRAAADLDQGSLARALRRMGVDRTALREAASAEIDAYLNA